MEVHKPLPDTPIHAHITSLSTEARSHRSRFIRHALSEIEDAALERRYDDWIHAMEDALDDISQCATRENWLSAFRWKREAERKQSQMSTDSDMVPLRCKKEVIPSSSKASNASESRIHRRVEKSDSTHVLAQLQKFVSLPSLPTPNPVVKHLVLCVAPYGTHINVPLEGGLHYPSSHVGCVFMPGAFSFAQDTAAPGSVIYGLSGWDSTVALSEGTQLHIVGGTLILKGATSPAQHSSLIQVLQVAIYLHLSLVLEQHLLADSNVRLQYPRPNLPTPSPSENLQTVKSNTETKEKSRGSIFPSGFFSFLSKRALSHRSTTVSPIIGHGGSLDLGFNLPPRMFGDESPRSSLDGIGRRLRRISLRGGSPSRVRKVLDDPNRPYSSACSRVEESKKYFSTSFDISFRPPEVLVNIARQEKIDPGRRLRGKEKCALTTLLGWDSKESYGKGMSGLLGFARQQSFSVLVSLHLRHGTPTVDEQLPKPFRTTCARPRLITYWYYAKGHRRDLTVGEMLNELSSTFPLQCDEPGCQYKCGQHQIRFMHDTVCIEVSFDYNIDESPHGGDGAITMWETCAICGVRSTSREMSDGAYLLSFAKYLELLIYSPAFHSLTPRICEHTMLQSDVAPETPQAAVRCNIARHFSMEACVITFSLTEDRDIFELHVPRLQMYRSGERTSHPMCTDVSHHGTQQGEERAVLRRQIKLWWEAVSDHLDNIEELLAGPDSDVVKKALPRLPSADDAYEDVGLPATIKASTISTYLTSSDSSHPTMSSTNDIEPVVVRVTRQDNTLAAPMTETDPLLLLSSMRHSFQRTEQSLYTQLSQTSIVSLNNVRRAFLVAGRGAQKRILAWQKKHLSQQQGLGTELDFPEPEWWDKKCHALPGGNIIVHEDDWGSLIAFILSSSEFLQELSNMSLNRSSSTTNVSTSSISHSSSFHSRPQTPQTPQTPTPSTTTAPKSYKLFSSAAQPRPDPDQEGAVWHESEAYAAVVTRKEYSRDSASLLSIREMLRSKTPTEATAGSKATGSVVSTSKSIYPTPSSAWAKPDVQVSKEEAEGIVSSRPDTVELAGKVLQELEIADSSRPEYHGSETSSISSIFVPNRHNKSALTISTASDDIISTHYPPPELPPKDYPSPTPQHDFSSPSTMSNQDKIQSSSSFANTLTSGLSYALRLMSSGQSTPRVSTPTPKTHHGLLIADTCSIDERPHIKYEIMGKRVKFSCTVYFAKQFDLLRRRCGIDDIFVKSLSRSSNWAAEGGKSRSNFRKTSDDRFIIKTLVNAWNVGDLHVLLALAPSYFRYMELTASKPTILVKMLGFYTVEVKNLESGATQSKVDLVIMENLFYKRKVDKTFDLKGIQGRKVKPNASDTTGGGRKRTLFDSEWIEGQQKTLMLVRPESKKVLCEAVRSDADYLARMNIMDYSLLLGIDEEGKQIVCGLVDTIGSYTFAKTLEYKAKHGLHSGKEVTVMPPVEYEDRFINALEGYFVACPDKWSKPLDESRIPDSIDQLPSVL
ncbi:hypothetical protein AX17_006862 [Amanita inopinata Kibby_2008]|nr:hypothetical protein AX17_006862 [Amanita inopinata Kibby_2008]